jgi:transcription antitermination factor NusG
LSRCLTSLELTEKESFVPLLPLEPYFYPDNLFAADGSWQAMLGDDARWWVLHTRPRSEKALARMILKKELPFFLPLYQRRWRSGSRTLASYLPLFPGYVFLCGTRDHRLSALETNLVANVLPVNDYERDALFEDLSRVYALMQSGSALTPEARLKPGVAVEISAGPFAGLEGKIIREAGSLRFLVEVRFVHQGVSVELESWMLQPELQSPLATAG